MRPIVIQREQESTVVITKDPTSPETNINTVSESVTQLVLLQLPFVSNNPEDSDLHSLNP